ncbi:hypothetical protein K502DRAFT_323039 [Neoconidiobolus thromboides FSU 785]|nr:hypothetical protein K502DRAFT_323039 [Neoconidiobolus thromboides FSU 785]
MDPKLDPTLEKYDQLYMQQNLETVDFLRSCLSMFSGAISGILGLKGYSGFLFYLICSIVMSMLIYVLKVLPTKQRLEDLFVSPMTAMMWHGVLGGLLSHVLFWTLFYGVVHVYI